MRKSLTETIKSLDRKKGKQGLLLGGRTKNLELERRREREKKKRIMCDTMSVGSCALKSHPTGRVGSQ